ncbi:hypothetical protein A1Q2_00204 [Trichosporon asahii var. asahii CBS 8904]|uniref:F-box domain-containing protein n=2 Tax=Trichosporon asahii var. asahii TaxID=189963 RepID=K1W9G7_TRIAC|nr:hypothetical protein A1Q1_03260 [Trichosporon asahii var. asahii CBS 2479]EJT47799.1 hypothetical protein A1Q1_03260 [Trichosporon asahii var. asahii CBS 2479]EKD05443.1 hypothetical protein A1Q2_00204 [Trichosporon asahii var. asahii CBS 8904]
MPTLSYEAYPALFDSIIAEVNFATELTLRLVCKSLRDAVDRHQVHHLVLTPSGKDSTSVRGPIYRTAALRRLSPKSASHLPAALLELLQHVRVLDIRGFFPATCNLTKLKNALPNLEIVRLCTRKGAYTPYVPVGARTLVVFTSPHGSDCNPKPYANAGKDGDIMQLMQGFEAMMGGGAPRSPILPKGINPRKLPKSVRRIVVNMSGEDYAVAEMYHFVLDPPEHIEEIVIILPRVEDIGFLEPDIVEEDTFAIKIIAMDLAELMIGIPHVKYTLVGVEEALRTDEEFLTILRKQFASYQFHGVEYNKEPTFIHKPDGGLDLRMDAKDPAQHEAKIDEIMARLQLLDFYDYEDLVGEEQARHETVEYLDGTDRDTRPRGIMMNDVRRMGPAAYEE